MFRSVILLPFLYEAAESRLYPCLFRFFRGGGGKIVQKKALEQKKTSKTLSVVFVLSVTANRLIIVAIRP